MRIRFERSGGFTGRRLQRSVDSTVLPGPQARRLEELLDQSHFFDLPGKMIPRYSGADRFNYKITVETDTGSHTVEASEAGVPPQLRPLLDWLAKSSL